MIATRPISATSHSSELSIDCYGPGGAATAIARWRRLEERLGSVGVAESAAWIEGFVRTYQTDLTFQFVFLADAVADRAAFLLGEKRGRVARVLPIRKQFVGATGEPQGDAYYLEYNRPLIELGFEKAAWESLAGRWKRESCDVLHVDAVDQRTSDSIQSAFGEVLVETRQGYRFEFSADVADEEARLASLGRSTRSSLRRLIRGYDGIVTEWAESAAEVHAVLDELIPLNRARWQATGRSSFDGRFETFIREAVEPMTRANRMVGFTVRDGAGTVGTMLHLIDQRAESGCDRHVLDYLSGMASFSDRKSPGLLCHWQCMQEAAQRGYASYDFLPGEKRHKKNLSNATYDLHWCTVKRASAANRVLDAARRIRRWRSAAEATPA